jgi:hypothetical protein
VEGRGIDAAGRGSPLAPRPSPSPGNGERGAGEAVLPGGLVRGSKLTALADN